MGLSIAEIDVGGILTSAREMWTGEKIVDPAKMAEFELQFKTLEQAVAMGQMGINKEEAKHSNVFVSGWRPFIGWVCGTALAFHFIVFPFVLWLVLISGVTIPVPPVLDINSLMTILGGLLGLGGMRTFEKFKNVEHKR